MTTDGPIEYQTWKARRLAALTAPDGWLTIVGRYRLTAGSVRVGSAGDNDIVLSAGPAHVGILRQDERGGVVFAPADGSRETVLSIDPWKPARFQAPDLLLEVVRFNDENALRVRHTTARAPHAFGGLDYFPYDPAWRVVADWRALETPRRLTIDTAKGVSTEVVSLRKAVFVRDGRTFELLATHGTPEAPQFVLRDGTSGKETFGPARFVFGEAAAGDRVTLDFNKAVNPPCAFSAHTTCPFPPPENVLPIRIEAGERAVAPPGG